MNAFEKELGGGMGQDLNEPFAIEAMANNNLQGEAQRARGNAPYYPAYCVKT
ncbi:MAG: hypothetical protein JST22_16590 [Bacteroidetes bacterium]|nr:hypothetical protein [Bacteroidota bacterium]